MVSSHGWKEFPLGEFLDSPECSHREVSWSLLSAEGHLWLRKRGSAVHWRFVGGMGIIWIECPAVSRMTKSTTTTPSIHAVEAPSSGACTVSRRILALMLVVCCLGSICRPDFPSVGHEKTAGIQEQVAITGITPGTPGDSSIDAPLLWVMVETPDQDRSVVPPCRSDWWWGNRSNGYRLSLGGDLRLGPGCPVDVPGRLLIREWILQTALL